MLSAKRKREEGQRTPDPRTTVPPTAVTSHTSVISTKRVIPIIPAHTRCHPERSEGSAFAFLPLRFAFAFAVAFRCHPERGWVRDLLLLLLSSSFLLRRLPVILRSAATKNGSPSLAFRAMNLSLFRATSTTSQPLTSARERPKKRIGREGDSTSPPLPIPHTPLSVSYARAAFPRRAGLRLSSSSLSSPPASAASTLMFSASSVSF
jgi:hypothetical protein